MIYLQHEVRGYSGCSKCKKTQYPYYRGSDKQFYCEDCAIGLVKDGLGKYGLFDHWAKREKPRDVEIERLEARIESLEAQLAQAEDTVAQMRFENWEEII